MTPNYPARLQLAQLPTPLEPLARLSKHLGGPELWIKRDDLTGYALSGNKTRKLEYLLADAQANGYDHLITMGGPQSNHCRQTAAAAARVGMGCSLILRGHGPSTRDGNLLLDQLFGAYLYWSEDETMTAVATLVEQQLTARGRKPYLIPLGGSNVLGATGYVNAIAELSQQVQESRLNFDYIVFGSSSGGTQAGLALGLTTYQLATRLLAISIDQPAAMLRMQAAALATATATHLGLGLVNCADIMEVNADYIGDGYGVMSDVEREAISMVAQQEGILLDPVYTGRAMGALIDLIRWGAFTRGQRILFWHTGGTPALFAYSTELQD